MGLVTRKIGLEIYKAQTITQDEERLAIGFSVLSLLLKSSVMDDIVSV